ncbi:MAG: formylglycine-generating enzyme family protein [Lewinellaceae bacterium]|nr:formylglycine-generating enzyme family protein [Lewinellaceae bacterium]
MTAWPDARDQCPDTWGSQPNGCPPEAPKGNDMARDLAAWKTAKEQDTEAAYLDYLRRFPQGEFKELANQALRRLEAAGAYSRDDTAWSVATEKNTLEGYKKYLADYPDGLHRSEADAKVKALEDTGNMVRIPGGTFQMGSNDGESHEKPVHSVTVSDFYLSKYEVTLAEFKAFVDATGYRTDAEKAGVSGVYIEGWKDQNGVNWKYDTRGNLRPSGEYNHPVIHVSWNDAVAYCDWLSKKTGQAYRLPTEAEWEYAAGGGSNARTKWSSTSDENNLTRYANLGGNEDGYLTTAPVGSLQPNTLGLYDMSGNVLEWCSDWYGTYSSGSYTNPTGPASGSLHVLRGGSWVNAARYARVAVRESDRPDFRLFLVGFRLARTY